MYTISFVSTAILLLCRTRSVIITRGKCGACYARMLLRKVLHIVFIESEKSQQVSCRFDKSVGEDVSS